MFTWKFILPLLGGILFSMATLAHFFDFVLGHEVYRVWLYASFIGLILSSVLFCAKQIPKWGLKEVLGLIVGAVLAFELTGTSLQFFAQEKLYDVHLPGTISNPRQLDIKNYDPEQNLLKQVPESTLTAMLAQEVIALSTPVFSC